MILTPGSILGLGGLALALEGVLVEQVLGHLVVVGIHAGEVGDVVAQLLDGLHLLVEVVALQEVTQLSTTRGKRRQFGKRSEFTPEPPSLGQTVTTYMGVSMVRGQLVQVQQSLVHVLLQRQCTLHGLQPAAPLVTLWFLGKDKQIIATHCATRGSVPDRCEETCRTPPVRTNLDVVQDDASASLVLEGQQLIGVLPLLLAVLLEEVGEAVQGHVVTGEVESLRRKTGRFKNINK